MVLLGGLMAILDHPVIIMAHLSNLDMFHHDPTQARLMKKFPADRSMSLEINVGA